VKETQQYPAAEMERMMKVQDVLLKAMAKKITWWAAAEIIGVSDRTMRRLTAVAYKIAQGSVATYYPEANVLVALDHYDTKSGTPSPFTSSALPTSRSHGCR
jgi:hypothetical protein